MPYGSSIRLRSDTLLWTVTGVTEDCSHETNLLSGIGRSDVVLVLPTLE